MAQRQIELHMKEKGITTPIAVGKIITVSGNRIRLDIEYGKKVKQVYSMTFTHEEWLTLNSKVEDCSKIFGMCEKMSPTTIPELAKDFQSCNFIHYIKLHHNAISLMTKQPIM